MRHRDHIQAALRHPGIIFFVFGALMLFGIWSLPQMSKDEFPQFTIRQGVVAAVYPGATAEEIEQQVTIPLEAFINSYEEVDKRNTYSVTEDGVVYCYVMLRNSVKSMGEAWAKMRAGLALFKKTSLPAGVAEVVVVDDFGNTASILLAIESPQRSLSELKHFADILTRQLREIPEVGKLRVLGTQQEEIAVTVDMQRLAAYGLSPTALQLPLGLQGLRTMGGNGKSQTYQVTIPYSGEYEIGEQIIRIDPVTGAVLRLRDIATIERRYPKPEQYVRFYRHGEETQSTADKPNALIVSMEIEPGNNIVAFGTTVEGVLEQARQYLPPDIRLHRVTDQPKVVYDSVRSFIRDILISIIVVIAVMLLLFPLRTALVASTGVPVCIAICIGLMYLTGIELNTVTLAALIFVLGMIVDDSVIVIDGYTNLLEKGWSRWYSATVSTNQLFVPMSLATCAIAGMFFPMTKIITGPLGEFVQLFPFAVAFALGASIFYAAWVTPYLSTHFIKRARKETTGMFERGQERFFAAMQRVYQRLLAFCFRRRGWTYLLLAVALGSGLYLLTRLNLQLLPKAERECFAVEIHLRQGAPIEETAMVADSLARILVKDERVRCITSFVGQASPRFHATYTPQMPAPNYAQFVVGATNSYATAALLREYTPLYENYFSNAYVRFKQLDYQVARNPLEVRLAYAPFADELTAEAEMQLYIDSLKAFMAQRPEQTWVHTRYEDISYQTLVQLRPTAASRLGITQSMLSLYLASVTHGVPLTTLYTADEPTPVVLYARQVDEKDLSELMVPTGMGSWVPLRQVADLVPAWHHTHIEHRNGVPTITIGADLRGATSQVDAEQVVRNWLKGFTRRHPTDNIRIKYGGLSELNEMIVPQILWSVVAALLVMFVLLLYHFGKIRLALLALSSAALCVFGAFLGLWLFALDISITAVLGIVSLIGIIVRNAIMMYEYAEELRHTKHLSMREAAYEAGLRRMRPVFLTSATTALGVLPMIIAHTSLWMPMGVVICFGTIFTLPLTLTILPVLYWRIMRAGNE